MMWWRPLAALVAAASATALLAPTASAADPEAADPPDASVGAFAPLPSVRFIYAVPTDREFSPVFESVVARSALHFQGWLLDRTGGTFVIRHGPLPQRCRMPGEHDHYLRGERTTHGSRGDIWDNVMEGVRACAPVGWDDPYTVWVINVAIEEPCGEAFGLGRGGGGMAVFGAEDSEAAGFSGDFDEEVPFHPRCNDDPIYVSAWGMYPGAMGHEILHALGAVHPEGCGSSGPGGEHGPSIMCWGLWDYPQTYIDPSTLEALEGSRFIRRYARWR